MITKPRELQLELAGYCNATCEFCDWPTRPHEQKRFMDPAMAKKLVAEGRRLQVRQITFHVTGESLMHPQLLDILPRDYPILISTNALLLEGELARRLAAMDNLLIILAMLWAEPEARRDQSVRNGFDYLSLNPRNRGIYGQIICSEHAVGQAPRMYREFSPFLARLPQLHLHFKQPYTQEAHRPTTGYLPVGIPEGPRVQVDRMPTPQSCGPDCVAFSPNPDSDVIVQSDGQIKPCFKRWPHWNLGNARDTTLLEAWNSPRFEEIRRIWRSGDPDGKLACHDCIRMAVPLGPDGKPLPAWWAPAEGGPGSPPTALNRDQASRSIGWICPGCGSTFNGKPQWCPACKVRSETVARPAAPPLA
jgi:radical SAM protein with 4Fe4S-binding SPASM domain